MFSRKVKKSENFELFLKKFNFFLKSIEKIFFGKVEIFFEHQGRSKI